MCKTRRVSGGFVISVGSSWRLRQMRSVALLSGALLITVSAAGDPSYVVKLAAALRFN